MSNKRIEKVYTLSPMQAGMFFHSLKNENSQAYFEQIIFEIAGNLRPELLEESFNLLLERYDILRTVFRADKLDEPHQFVLKQRNFKLYFEDISHLSAGETKTYLDEFVQEDRRKIFDLGKDILMRASLFKTGNTGQVLVWSFHHILMDGWCLGIIYKELLQIYRLLADGKPVKLPPVTPYINYIHWLQRQDKAEGLSYWKNYLEGYDSRAGLPGKGTPKTSGEEYRPVEYDLELAKETIAAVTALAGANRVTINTLFQTLWGILLQKYNNCADVVFGAVVSGRQAEVNDIENIIGLFINTVPVRVKSYPGYRFVQLLRQINEETIQSRRYEYLPLAEIQAQTELKESLIDHIMVFENIPLKLTQGITMDGVTIGNVTQRSQTGYDFNIIIIPHETLLIKFDYNSPVYESQFIERLGQHLVVMINQVTAGPEICVQDIEIITEAERRQILIDFNNTRFDYPGDKTIHQLFAEQAARIPDHIAIFSHGRLRRTRTNTDNNNDNDNVQTLRATSLQVTYFELNRQADRLASLLIEKGVLPDTIVGIMMERSIEMIIGIMAILKAGCAYMPIDPGYPQERIDYMLKDSNAKLTINYEFIKEAPQAPFLHHSSFIIHHSNHLAYIIYTSGSSGKPKGVMVPHRAVVNRMNWVMTKYGLNQEDVVMQKTSYVFDVSVCELFRWIMPGARLFLLPPWAEKDAGAICSFIEKYRITTIDFVPSLLMFFLEYLDEEKSARIFRSLRWVFVGAEVVSPVLVSTFRRKLARYCGARLINAYGPTEATVDVTYFDCTSGDLPGVIPIGKPMANVQLRIVDHYGCLQPIDVPGELCISGDALAHGYLNNPELTNKSFSGVQGAVFQKSPLVFYKTGDLAKWLPAGPPAGGTSGGVIQFLGRIDNQVKIRGFRVELGEIENRLRAHQGIKDTVVLIKEDALGDKYICAYIVSNVSELHLREYLGQTLPDYMLPSYFIRLDSIPLTPTGKVDKKALPGPKADSGATYTAPRNEIEEKLALTWSEVLGIEKEIIGIDANFFKLGGHSLKATSAVAKIQKNLEVKVPLAQLFTNPTIRQLARFIQETGDKEKFLSIPAVEKKEYYVLSSAQKRLYLLDQMNPGNTVYNMPALFDLAGELEPGVMEKIFRELIGRHESLRTSFHMIGGEPVQRIHDRAGFNIEFLATDACGVHGQTRTHNVENLLNFIRPFDLTQAPLLRVVLGKENNKKYKLMLDMHHIITDGTSTAILIKEFIALYQGEMLPELVIQYKDYSQWQNRLLQNEIIKQQETYWLNRLAGEIPVLDLPTDHERPVVQSFAGNVMAFRTGEKETQQLRTLALEEGVSLFMALLAVFNVFLSKICGQEHIIVGTPTAGRRHEELQKITGMFINTLPLSHEPVGGKRFHEFLREVKTNTLEDFENQDYQFEDLVDKLAASRDTGRNPLFDVMFGFQNMDIPGIEIPGLKFEPYPFEIKTTKFDMVFNGVELNPGILFSVEYSIDLFNRETIERLINYFNRVMVSVSTNPGQWIADIEIITDDEKQEILNRFNDTGVDYPKGKTVVSLFEEQVERTPDHIVLFIGPGRDVQQVCLSYRRLNGQSDQLAGFLIEKGILPDTIVGIMATRTAETIINILAILKSGGAYMPIDPKYPQERIDYMLKDSTAKVLLINKSEIRNPKLETNPNKTNSNDPNKNQNSGAAHWRKLEFNLGVEDSMLQLFSLTFDGVISSFFATIVSGARAVFLPDEESGDVKRIKETLLLWRITHFICVPSLYGALLAICTPSDIKGLKSVGMGGEALKPSVVEKSKQLHPALELTNEYGPTEITIFCTLARDVQPVGNITIGKPIANVIIYILDKHDHLVPVGIPGELYIGGAGVTRGYLNRPELTAEKFINLHHSSFSILHSNFYRSGDLARWLPAAPGGVIQFLGRIDQQVKIRGFRIELGEIENQLLKHKKIKEAVVIDRVGEDGNTYLCAYWVPDADEVGDLTVSKLREFLSGQLAPYMIPSYFIQLEKIPISSSGKIDRKALPQPGIDNIKLDSAYVEPQENLEKQIAGIWKTILKHDKVGTHDNFFDLGGNSLKILQVHHTLTETLNIKIPAIDLFKYPTIAALSSYLKQQTIGSAAQSVAPEPGALYRQESTDVAVIGMAGRFPGADNIDRFWENIKNGVESITFFTTEELAEQGISAGLLADAGYVKAGGILENKDRFDAAFFHYTPPEAKIMDPQMRIFHECVWESLEDAGYDPGVYDKPIGLYAGAANNIGWAAKVFLFAQDDLMNAFESHQLTDCHFIPTRISYKLNLKGPAIFVQTACSTSLTAVHVAYNALSMGDCAVALAGGISLYNEKKSGYLYREGLVMSPDGHCRAFDAGAGGTVGGEGAAVVLLKPLPQAVKDNDHIYAVIKATTANNDGARKVGFSAPSIDGQAEAIAAVYRKAGISTESITFIETHGTGTALGDPIELSALKQVFNTARKNFCALGSVKSNLGHMDTAAGAVGFIKAVLALKHKQIPPTLHFQIPNAQFDLIDSPFYVNTMLKSWETGPYPLRAGVSSFGIGGTNAHVILEEYVNNQGAFFEKTAPWTPEKTSNLILLSAKTITALDKMKGNLHEYLEINKEIPLADIAYTLQYGRKLFPYKWMALCTNIDEAAAALAAPGNGEPYSEIPNWEEYYEKEKRNRVSLPTYPFEIDGQHYWIQGDPFNIKNIQHISAGNQALKRQDIADWFYLPRWKQSTLPPSSYSITKQGTHCLLVFANNSPLVLKLIKKLANYGTGKKVITVTAGETFTHNGDSEFTINPQNNADYNSLFTGLYRMELFPQRIIHCWNVSMNAPLPGPGFYSLFYLTKAISRQNFDGNIAMDIITANAQEVTGNETLIPANALALGPIKVIPQEYPYIICRSIDIDLLTPA
ncbi:MAG: amino acid adenylation domain-containing protein, partial [Acidobacteria bacterium]|nr:amino acid adenylation domain-containing protein [Acidobacteriota bacterium]